MRLTFTEYVPAGTLRMTYRPSRSVAAPSGTPTRMTLAPASGCFFASETTPVSFPTVPACDAETSPHTASVARAATLAILPVASAGLNRTTIPSARRRSTYRSTGQQHPPSQRGLAPAVLLHPQAVRVEPAL